MLAIASTVSKRKEYGETSGHVQEEGLNHRFQAPNRTLFSGSV